MILTIIQAVFSLVVAIVNWNGKQDVITKKYLEESLQALDKAVKARDRYRNDPVYAEQLRKKYTR